MSAQLDMIEGPSEIDQLVSMAEGKGRAWYRGVTKTISVRLPVHTYSVVAGLAEISGTSMNVVCMKLIDASLEQVAEQLSQGARERLVQAQAKAIAELGGEYEGGEI